MTRPVIPIALEVNAAVRLPGLERAVLRLHDELLRLRDELGLPGDVDVTSASTASRRAITVRVHGAVRPYSRRLLLRAWRAVAPPGLHDLTRLTVSDGGGLPDAWIRIAAQVDPDPVVDLVWQIALEAIKARPGCLVGPGQAAAYAGEAEIRLELLAPALARLLELGISLRDRDTIIETLTTAHGLGLGLDDAVEAIFDRLRSGRVEVYLSSSYLGIGAPEQPLDAELARRFPLLEATLAADLGIACPGLALLAQDGLGDHVMGVRVNDVMALIPILRPDELLAAESPNRLEQLGIAGRTFPNPATGADHLAVADSARPELERLQLTYWTPAGLVPLVVYSELWRLCDRVIGAADVQRQLARIERSAPALVEQALSRWTVRQIVHLMRSLVAEAIAPKSLETILELLVTFDTVRRQDDHLVVFDDRPPAALAPSAALLRWLRAGLRRRLNEQWTGGRDFVVACALDPQTEARAAAGGRPLSDASREALMVSLWEQLAATPPAAESRPILLTSPRARTAVRALVRDELPDTQVVADSEIQPGIRIHPLSTTEGRMSAQVTVTADRVQRFLERLVGAAVIASEAGTFDLVLDGVPLRVEVVPEGPETIVIVSAETNRRVPATAELLRWLMERSDDSWFAHLGCTTAGDTADVYCRHALLGNFIDYEELRLAVQAVARQAANTADPVHARFGGVTAFASRASG